MTLEYIIYYGCLMITTVLSVLGAGIGGGLASTTALEAIDIQPRAQKTIMRTCIIGLALIETAAILALVLTGFMFTTTTINLPTSIAHCAMACAVGIPALVVGIVSALPVQSACLSIARQPFFGQQILNLMLITQSIIQTSIIFGFIIAWVIRLKLPALYTLDSVTPSISLCAAGLAIGVGAIGPSLGLAFFAQTACDVISFDRTSYNKIIPFVFMSEAIIETPLLFAFLIALIIAITPISSTMLVAAKMIAAALCIAIGTYAPSINSSKTASSACKQIVYNQSLYSTLSQTSMFGQGLIDAAAVYALLIASLILFIM